MKPTLLNNVKVEIRVTEGIVVDPGVFSAKYVSYNVSTTPLGYDVKRKTQDFYVLRKMLKK